MWFWVELQHLHSDWIRVGLGLGLELELELVPRSHSAPHCVPTRLLVLLSLCSSGGL